MLGRNLSMVFIAGSFASLTIISYQNYSIIIILQNNYKSDQKDAIIETEISKLTNKDINSLLSISHNQCLSYGFTQYLLITMLNIF